MGLDSVDPSRGARDHVQVVWNERLVAEVRQSAQLWFREDCGLEVDWTSAALVNKSTESSLTVLARTDGVIAGLHPGAIVVDFGTSLPGSSRALALEVAATGGHFLDAPLGRTPAHV